MKSFPHLNLPDEEAFITRLWMALQAGGHLLAREHVKASLEIVDLSFSPPPVQPQQN